MAAPLHRAPSSCPVCSSDLITTRLGCPNCGTEVSGSFRSCRYCRLSTEDLQTLEVFLRSRGNMRDVQAHLAVSYPTARQRFAQLLARLGMGDEATVDTTSVMADLAAGRIDVAEAQALLEGGS
jgi:hypothetical protein